MLNNKELLSGRAPKRLVIDTVKWYKQRIFEEGQRSEKNERLIKMYEESISELSKIYQKDLT